jgi:hypothetical protein
MSESTNRSGSSPPTESSQASELPLRRRRKGNGSTRQTGCSFVMCEDPKTGEMVVRPKGHCPRGYIEKAKAAIKERGLLFYDPRNDE